MEIRDVQRLLLKNGDYKGSPDGEEDQKTLAAVDRILVRNKDKISLGKKPSAKRRRIAAAQLILNAMGFEAGAVDGLEGHNTRNALSAWDETILTGKRPTASKRIEKNYVPPKTKANIPLQKDVAKYYGRPGPEVKRQLVFIDLPFAMRIDWNLGQTVRRIRIHKKCAPSLRAALIEVYEFYGAKRFKELGLDRFAGSYNHRKMRGGRSWSMHAYACAIDFFAQPNGLKARCPRALFCGEEYKPFIDIMEKHGWISLGRAIGRDWMHFQRARLR